MSDFLIPTWARISGGRYDWLSNTVAFPSTFTGSIRTTDRLGDRVAVKLATQSAAYSETAPTRAALSALRARMRGQSGRVLYANSGYTPRGSFSSGELLTNNDFSNGTTSFSTSSANIVLSVSDRILRSKRASVSGDETIRAAVATTVSGATYIARVFAYAGRGAMDFRIRLGTSAGGSEIAASGADITTAGMSTLTGTASGTSTHFSIVDGVSGRSIGGYMDFLYVSLSRCALIQGASQTGPSYTIDQLPTSTSGLALQDDWVQIGNQLAKVVQPLDSDSSGVGSLHLSYPLRATPADNAPVIFHQPFGRFVATENEGGYDFTPDGSNHEFSLVEDLSS